MEEKIENDNFLSKLYNEYRQKEQINNNINNDNNINNNIIIINDNNINNISSINNDNSIINERNISFNDNYYINNSRNNSINSIKYEFMSQMNVDNNDNYCKIIVEELDKIRKKTTVKFSNCIKNFNESYFNYKDNISKYIEKIDNNFSNLNIFKTNDVLLNYASKNIYHKLDYLYQIYLSIIANIENNFELLNIFLKQKELIEQKNPNEYFLDKNYDQIFNCSLINKLNYESTDISKISNNNYYKNFLHFLNKEEKNKEDNREKGNKKNIGDDKEKGDEENKGIISFRKYTIIKNNLQEVKSFISKNYHLLKAIEIKDINSANLRDILNEIFKNQNLNKNNILKKMILNNCDLKKEIKNIEYIKFNKIEELSIKSGSLNILFLPHLFLANTTNLKHLSLEKINMSNIGLNILFGILPKYFDNLEYLSLAKNSITEVKNIFNVEENIPKSFSNLKYFNLHKNSIYYFGMELEKFPQMKLLDLTSNSFNNEFIMSKMIKKKDNLVLFNDNIFISNCEENNNIYTDYLKKRLKVLNFGLKILHLCFAYEEKTQSKLEKLELSPSIIVSLIKLDLSFCGLKTDTVMKFLKKNVLFSLKVLDLKYNNIKNDIFEEFVCDDEIKIEKLTSLNLSENYIDCQKYEENEYLIKFIEKYQKLEAIKLYYCPFFGIWNMNISPDVDLAGKLGALYKDFKVYLNKSNRNFKFQINKNQNSYIEKRFDDLFEFK